MSPTSVLDRWNARHPWSHNDHFHPWILRNLPARRRLALDVGCGEGKLLAALSRRFERVIGADTDRAMRETAAARCTTLSNVHVTAGPWDIVQAPPDLITMIAVLHHLPLEDSLRSVRGLLAPGGRFLVVGLARPSSLRDHAWELASVLTNPVIGAFRHPRPVRHPQADPYPVADSRETLAQVQDAAARIMPGVTVRRHLAFRYTLTWEKPA